MGRQKKEPKTGVFEPEDDNIIYENIRKLFDRSLLFHCRNELTQQDVMDVFVPAHLHQMAKDAVKELGVSPCWKFNFNTNSVGNVEVSGKFNFYFNKGFLDRQCAAMARIEEWQQRRLAIGAEWATVQGVFDELRKRCTRKEQVRAYWPPIVTLLGNSPTATVLENYKPTSVGSLPVDLRRACMSTMESITRALLLPEEDPSAIPIALKLNNMPMVLRPWESHVLDKHLARF